VLVVLGASGALFVVAAILASKHRVAALALAAGAVLVLPWVASPDPLLRGLLALLHFVVAFRIIDLVRSREPWSAGRRVVHALSFIDSRRLRRVGARLDVRGLGAALAWGALAAVAFLAARDAAPRSGAAARGLEWGAGAVFVYATIDAGYAAIRAGYRAVGFETGRLHDWPAASTSVAELWGVRWARPVSVWLRDTCFLPLARRRRPKLGLLLGFVVSAAGHAYPVLVASRPTHAAMMFGFFLAQGLVVLAEPRLGVPRWPRPARRAWTVAILLATSVLFVEPALRVVLGG
jgi:hypothetical protein